MPEEKRAAAKGACAPSHEVHDGKKEVSLERFVKNQSSLILRKFWERGFLNSNLALELLWCRRGIAK